MSAVDISVLIPTRQRVRLLAGAIDSVFALAGSPERIEVLLRVDDDDAQTQTYAGEIGSVYPVKCLVAPRGDGYRAAHTWINDLCAAAIGDWLFVFNDDARILTPGWDDVVRAIRKETLGVEDDVLLVIPRVYHRPHSHEFFLVRRKVYEVLGHLALDPHVDTWIITIMVMLQRAFTCHVDLCHYTDRMADAVAQERRVGGVETMRALRSPAFVEAKLADLAKLLVYMKDYAGATGHGD